MEIFSGRKVMRRIFYKNIFEKRTDAVEELRNLVYDYTKYTNITWSRPIYACSHAPFIKIFFIRISKQKIDKNRNTRFFIRNIFDLDRASCFLRFWSFEGQKVS